MLTVGEKRYSIDTLVQAFEHFVLSQSTYNQSSKDTTFSYSVFPRSQKMTFKRKQLYNSSSFSTLEMIYF